jgi:hypothetical protein
MICHGRPTCDSRPNTAPQEKAPSLLETKNKSPRSSAYPLGARSSVCAPSPIVHSSAAALCPSPPPHAPSSATPCAHPSHLYHSLPCRPSVPIIVARAADPAMAARAHVSWCLRSFLTKPRALMSVTGAGGARVSRLAIGSHPDGQNRPARPSSPLCCIHMFQVFQTF